MCKETAQQSIEAEYAQARAGSAYAMLKLELRATRHLVDRLRRQFPQVPAGDIADLLHDLTLDLHVNLSRFGHWRQALAALRKALYRELRRQVRRRRALRTSRVAGERVKERESSSALAELHATLERFAASLPNNERLILLSRLYGEPKARDLPRLVNQSQATIKRRWKAIKARLRRLLEDS